jgi:hypothetical protein
MAVAANLRGVVGEQLRFLFEVRIHRNYVAFFRFAGAAAARFAQRAAAAFLAISDRCSGVSFFIRASPLNFPPFAPWRLK